MEQFNLFKEKIMQDFNLSINSKERYIQSVNKFLESTGKPIPLKEDVMGYLSQLKNKGFSNTYLHFVYFSIQKYCEVLSIPLDIKKKERPKLSQAERPMMTEEQAHQFGSLVKDDARMKAIIALCVYCGPRRSEIVKMRVGDYKKTHLHIRTSKNEEKRILKLNPLIIAGFDEYLKVRNIEGDSMFGLTTDGLTFLFRKYADKMGLPPRYGFHSIRRSLVTWLNKAGMDHLTIQKHMGWKSLSMVGVYAQLSPDNIYDEVERLHPFNKKK